MSRIVALVCSFCLLAFCRAAASSEEEGINFMGERIVPSTASSEELGQEPARPGDEGPDAGGLKPPVSKSEQRLRARDATRRMRRFQRLQQVMRIEGEEYSADRYRAHSAKLITGIALTVVGGISFISGFFYGASTLIESFLDDLTDHSDEPYDYSKLYHERRVPLHSLFWGGLLGLIVGVPMIVGGAVGRGRQNILKQKAHILKEARIVSLGFRFDPASSAGAISLGVSF